MPHYTPLIALLAGKFVLALAFGRERALLRGMAPTKTQATPFLSVCSSRFAWREAWVRGRTESCSQFGHAAEMSLPIVIKAISNRPGAGERSDYLIDGFRVSFLHQAEWKCACAEFHTVGTCRHTREAGGMRDAQARIRRRLRSGGSDFLPYAPGRRAHVLARNRT